jgi:DNA-binding NtrC family response regulator
MSVNMTRSGDDMGPPHKHDRLLIIDDDICFGALMSAIAPKYHLEPRFFPSLVDMGSFARIKDFDIAIIDYFLGHLRGDEIAEYVDTFFANIPVIIVSAEETLSHREKKWPESVRMFLPKATGPDGIAAAARKVLTRDRFLRRLESTTHENLLSHGS